MRSANTAARTAWRASLLLLAIALSGCDTIFGVEDEERPGRKLLEPFAYGDWMWLPGEREILYGTRFDYPYTGPPSRLEAVDVSSGAVRVVAELAAAEGRVIPYRFQLRGGHVYFEVSTPRGMALYRAALSGGFAPELVIDSLPHAVSVSEDGRTLAWLSLPEGAESEPAVLTLDLATGEAARFGIEEFGAAIVWSPDGRSVVVPPLGFNATGTSFQWLDLENGELRVWTAPPQSINVEHGLDYHWQGATPYVYVTGSSVARYSIGTGEREHLAPAGGRAAGWTADFGAVALLESSCTRWSEPFIFGSTCLRWHNRAVRLALDSGQRATLLDFQDTAPVFGRLSPGGTRFAFAYGSGASGGYSDDDGLYVVGD